MPLFTPSIFSFWYHYRDLECSRVGVGEDKWERRVWVVGGCKGKAFLSGHDLPPCYSQFQACYYYHCSVTLFCPRNEQTLNNRSLALVPPPPPSYFFFKHSNFINFTMFATVNTIPISLWFLIYACTKPIKLININHVCTHYNYIIYQ